MRILYLCGDQGIPVFGRKGASTHIREMIAAWRRAGHEVMLAAPDLSGDRRPDESYPTFALPAPRSKLIGHDGRYLLANALSWGPLLQAAAEFRPDALYERSALYFTTGEKLAARLGVPRILEMNALLSEEQEERLHFPAVARRVEHRLARRAAGVAVISNVMKRMLVELGCEPERIRPFSMAVDPRRFQHLGDGSSIRARLGWPAEDVVLGYVGSMNSYHRPNWFMDLAEKMLRRGDRGIRFLVVGGSNSKVARHQERLRPWVKGGLVHFAGTVPQDDMAEWLLAMSAVIIPGASPQSTPTKIFESAALSRPLIMPATEPVIELTGPDSPFLFPPEDFRALETRVKCLIADPPRFTAEARRLHDVVLQDYTWDHHAAELVSWLERMRSAGR
jgi:glycosyltransferase involved in cell wall biosynthesis